MTATPMSYAQLRDASLAVARSMKAESEALQPMFIFSVGWATDYSHLFQSKFERETKIEVVIDEAFKKGRILLCGRGGSGKTSVVKRLAGISSEMGMIAIFMDMKRWSSHDQSSWTRLAGNTSGQIDYMLQNLSSIPLTLSQIDRFAAGERKIFFVDGLNEVPSRIADEIVGAIDDLAAILTNSSVVATDRMVRRQIRAARWSLATLKPLDQSVIEAALAYILSEPDAFEASRDERDLLEIPFFLDKTLRERRVTRNSADTLRDFFLHHVSLTETGIQETAAAAYASYGEEHARTFKLEAFRQRLRAPVLERLVTSGVLISSDDGRAWFSHHLYHDYLASVFVAMHDELWSNEAFNAVSFYASSFDAIALILEQLSVDQGDGFVRKVYDWNLYAAAYAIAESIPRRVSPEMEHVMLAMLAERRLDIVTATAQRAEDALSLFPTVEAQTYLEANNLDEIIAAVSAAQTEQGWFKEWRALFVRRSSTALDDDIKKLADVDSILGWTLANVLKRLKLNPAQLSALRSLLSGEASVAVRWRIAHVLGAFPDAQNRDALFDLLARDPDDWVRYGAVRSLVEMAAVGDDDMRDSIFGRLASHVDLLTRTNRVLDEFARAAVIKPGAAKGKWLSAVSKIVQILIDRSGDAQELDRWARYAYELRRTYAAQSS